AARLPRRESSLRSQRESWLPSQRARAFRRRYDRVVPVLLAGVPVLQRRGALLLPRDAAPLLRPNGARVRPPAIELLPQRGGALPLQPCVEPLPRRGGVVRLRLEVELRSQPAASLPLRLDDALALRLCVALLLLRDDARLLQPAGELLPQLLSAPLRELARVPFLPQWPESELPPAAAVLLPALVCEPRLRNTSALPRS